MLSNKKILIVDDEVLIAEHLKSIIQTFGCYNIELAHTKKSAFAVLENFKPDVVLLDIRLHEDKEGIEIGIKLNEEFKIPFIYVSAFSDRIVMQKALSTHPASFITKPFKVADIFAALSLIFINNPNLSKAYINFKYGNEHIKLSTAEIHWIEREGNYISINTSSKKYLLRNSIEWIIEQLPDTIFFRVHRSYVINLKSVVKHTSEYVYIQNIQIPISRNAKDGLIQKIVNVK